MAYIARGDPFFTTYMKALVLKNKDLVVLNLQIFT